MTMRNESYGYDQPIRLEDRSTQPAERTTPAAATQSEDSDIKEINSRFRPCTDRSSGPGARPPGSRPPEPVGRPEDPETSRRSLQLDEPLEQQGPVEHLPDPHRRLSLQHGVRHMTV